MRRFLTRLSSYVYRQPLVPLALVPPQSRTHSPVERVRRLTSSSVKFGRRGSNPHCVPRPPPQRVRSAFCQLNYSLEFYDRDWLDLSRMCSKVPPVGIEPTIDAL